MNCCEQSGMTHGCNQGHDCPVRTSHAASAGEAYPLPIWFAGDEPDEVALDAKERMLVWMAVACTGLITGVMTFGFLGYSWTRWFA